MTLKLEWTQQETFASQPLLEWFVDGEVAGKTRRAGPLTYATIKDAGHLVRQLRVCVGLMTSCRSLNMQTPGSVRSTSSFPGACQQVAGRARAVTVFHRFVDAICFYMFENSTFSVNRIHTFLFNVIQAESVR